MCTAAPLPNSVVLRADQPCVHALPAPSRNCLNVPDELLLMNYEDRG